MKKIRSVLVANRGEIAIRVFRACNELGIRTVAIYSKEDSLSLHRFRADESYLVGEGKKPVDAYLDIEDIIRIAHEHDVDAIHPGYGFLSENADLAKRCEEEGIIFIGPKVEHLIMFGDKINARIQAKKAGIQYIPGSDGPVMNYAEVEKFAKQVGFPIMLKAVNGGGGRGMRMVDRMADLRDATTVLNRKPNWLLAAMKFIWKNASLIRNTSKSRSWATNTAMSSTSLNATAPSSAVTRKSSKRLRLRPCLSNCARRSATQP